MIIDPNTNESAQNPANKLKITQMEVMEAQIRIEILLSLLQQINWGVVNTMLEITPENLKNSLSARALEITRSYYEQIEEIYRDNVD